MVAARGRSRSRGVRGEIARFRRSVGRGLDPAAGVCLMIPFLGHARVRSLRRGGIHAAREHCGCWAFVGCLLFILPCSEGNR